jgi:hypothetical protein
MRLFDFELVKVHGLTSFCLSWLENMMLLSLSLLLTYSESVCGCGEYNPKCQADPSQCWGNNGPASSPVSRPQPAPSPVSVPATDTVSTVYGDRKVRPSTTKTVSSRLSDVRGGSAARLSGHRELAKGEAMVQSWLEVPHAIQEVENKEKHGRSLRNSVRDGVPL